MEKRRRRSSDISSIAAAVALHPAPNRGRHHDARAGADSSDHRVTNGQVPDEFLLVNCGRCGRPLLVRLEDVMMNRMIDCARRGSDSSRGVH